MKFNKLKLYCNLDRHLHLHISFVKTLLVERKTNDEINIDTNGDITETSNGFTRGKVTLGAETLFYL